jgi:ubiquinone/menaquinone biosynthesis C-methylase UbiE
MSTAGSYKLSEEHSSQDLELSRLKAQALLSWRKELSALTAFGLRDGMKILEVGAGPGFVTEQLLHAYPRSTVTALEIDSSLVARAREYLPKTLLSRAEFVQASVMRTTLPDGAFDFVIARLIFQHLPDPVVAAAELFRVLKPGGKLVIIDIDDGVFGIMDPPSPTLPIVLDRYAKAQAARGGNRHIGRQFWRILRAAQFRNLRTEAVLLHSDEIGIDAFLPQIDPDRLLPLVRAGIISDAEWSATRASHKNFIESPAPFMSMIVMLGCGEKP